MNTLADIESHRQRAVALFCGDTAACLAGVQEYLNTAEPGSVAAILPDRFIPEDEGEEERQRRHHDGPNAVARGALVWPILEGWERPRAFPYFSDDHDTNPALLIFVSRVVWFYHAVTPPPADRRYGDFCCAVNIALALRMGIPCEFRDEHGAVTESPLVGAFGQMIEAALDEWIVWRRDRTERLCREGMRFAPDCCEPALWTHDCGALDLGDIEMPLDLMWRLQRLENWYGFLLPYLEWPEEEWLALRAERQACLAAARAYFGEETIGLWPTRSA